MSNRSSIPILHATLKYPEHLVRLEDMMDFIYEDGFSDDWVSLGLDEESDLPGMEYTLTASPTAGDVIPGTGGLRKLRWNLPGKGKRGGVRVIYLHIPEVFIIYCFMVYAKSQSDDLSSEAKKAISSYAGSIKNRLLSVYSSSKERAQ